MPALFWSREVTKGQWFIKKILIDERKVIRGGGGATGSTDKFIFSRYEPALLGRVASIDDLQAVVEGGARPEVDGCLPREGGRRFCLQATSRLAHLAYPVRRLGSQVPRATGYASPEVTLAGLPCCTFQLPGQKLHPLQFAQPAYPGTNDVAHPSLDTSSLPCYTLHPKGLAREKERREERSPARELSKPPAARTSWLPCRYL